MIEIFFLQKLRISRKCPADTVCWTFTERPYMVNIRDPTLATCAVSHTIKLATATD